MTQLLYYEAPMLTHCEARVLQCIAHGEEYKIQLDRTVIFPQGGGQLSDRGSIDGVEVTDAHIKDGVVYHYCAAPLEPGKTVAVELDVQTRLDRAQQHTGEHILSGLAKSLFGANNVGFHMAEDYATIDLDIPPDEEAIRRLEAEANRAVRSNLRIHTDVVSAGEAANRSLRKHADGIKEESVRIVYIDDGRIDSCTCCGTHLTSTGMTGQILITDFQRYKGGTRLTFLCGERAYKETSRQYRSMSALARRYSTSRDELASAVEKQIKELSAAKAELKHKSLMLAEYIANELAAASKTQTAPLPIVRAFDGMSANDMMLIGEALLKRIKCVALLFARRHDGADYRMVRSEGTKLSMKELCAAVNAAVNGRGGGSAAFAQGTTARSVSDDDVNMLEKYLINVLDAEK